MEPNINENKLSVLVLDTAAFIRGDMSALFRIANTICTTQAVVNEIRDPLARIRYDALPIQPILREPSPSALKAVDAASKESGDCTVLSLTDIQILALTLTIAEEAPKLEVIEQEEEEDDGCGKWQGPAGPSAFHNCQIGIVSTDNAVLNTLQFLSNSNIVPIDLNGNKSLVQIRSWIMRCGACFKVNQSSYLFCSHCGSAFMERVSCSVINGRLKLHLKRNRIPNNRGTIYPLPSPGGHDRHRGDILLREDQLRVGAWNQRVIDSRRRKHRMMESQESGMFGDRAGSMSGISDIQVGLGKGNPNQSKRKRKKKKESA